VLAEIETLGLELVALRQLGAEGRARKAGP
jgi:hypothetical protein